MSKIVYVTPNGRGRVIEGPYTPEEEIEWYNRQTPKAVHRGLKSTPEEPPQKSQPQQPEE